MRSLYYTIGIISFLVGSFINLAALGYWFGAGVAAVGFFVIPIVDVLVPLVLLLNGSPISLALTLIVPIVCFWLEARSHAVA